MKHYSKEFKEEALKLSDEIGVKKAAQQLGIAYYTLADWRSIRRNAPPAKTLSAEEQSIRIRELEREVSELRTANDIDTVRQLERIYPSLSGAVFHSDRGSQYTSLAFRSELSRCGMIQSLSGTGHCFDNARMESFFATLKKEKIYQIAAYKLPREQVKTIIFRYVFIYYNRVRIYTRNPLGLPPVKYREWAQAQTAA